MTKIHNKYEPPKITDFSTKDLVIDVRNGRLYYKSNNDVFELRGTPSQPQKVSGSFSNSTGGGGQEEGFGDNALGFSQPGQILYNNNGSIDGLPNFWANRHSLNGELQQLGFIYPPPQTPWVHLENLFVRSITASALLELDIDPIGIFGNIVQTGSLMSQWLVAGKPGSNFGYIQANKLSIGSFTILPGKEQGNAEISQSLYAGKFLSASGDVYCDDLRAQTQIWIGQGLLGNHVNDSTSPRFRLLCDSSGNDSYIDWEGGDFHMRYDTTDKFLFRALADPDGASTQLHMKSSKHCYITLEGDTDNVSEGDNSWIEFIQDGGSVKGVVGLVGEASDYPNGSTLLNGLGGNTVLANSMVVGPSGSTALNSALCFTTCNTSDAGAVQFQLTANGNPFFYSVPEINVSNRLRYNTSTGEVSYYSGSTRKIKKNIKTLTPDVVNNISKLKPKIYDFRNPDYCKIGKDIGFIAEEVAEIHPLFAQYGPDWKRDELGRKIKDDKGKYIKDSEEDVPMDINWNAIVSGLVGKIQDLEKRIKQLENK